MPQFNAEPIEQVSRCGGTPGMQVIDQSEISLSHIGDIDPASQAGPPGHRPAAD